MNKAQGAIVGTVLISSIIIGIVSVSYLWGKPLIDKSTDKVRIESLVSTMKSIESTIEAVSHGGSQTVNIGLEGNEELNIEDGGITLTTHTSVPIITALSWAPLNSYELPFQQNLYRANTSESCDTSAGCVCQDVSGDTNITTYDSNLTINNETYTVCNYNRTEGYNYTCLNNSGSPECRGEGSETHGLTIEVIGKNETIFSGNKTTVPGILGEDTPGIVMGKTSPTGGKQRVRLRIRFRPLIDKQGREYLMKPQCEGNCKVSSGSHEIRIRKEKTVKKADSTITYISLSID